MFCPNCDSENSNSAKFCKNCGNKISQNESRSAVPKRNNLVMGVVIAVIFLVIGAVLVGRGFLVNKNASTSQQQTTQAQSMTKNPTTNKPTATSKKDNGAADSSCGSQVKDADSNSYGTVQVGTQCWMASNMNVGVKIDRKNEPSDNKKIEKWCYDNIEAHCDSDGGLYTWDEAMQYSTKEGAQGICPSSWHVPTDAEQYTLENYLKDSGETCDSARIGYDCASAGAKLMNGGSSGMNFLLAGYRSTDGTFYALDALEYSWSSSVSVGSAWNRSLYMGNSAVYRSTNGQSGGFSVRCVKD